MRHPARSHSIISSARTVGGASSALQPPIDRRRLLQVNTALDDLRHGKVVGRVVLEP